jgi:hypothetical protein
MSDAVTLLPMSGSVTLLLMSGAVTLLLPMSGAVKLLLPMSGAVKLLLPMSFEVNPPPLPPTSSPLPIRSTVGTRITQQLKRVFIARYMLGFTDAGFHSFRVLVLGGGARP